MSKHLNFKFVFFIAWRYLFSKKEQNVINVISFISVCGIIVSTAALVCVMSVLGGFVDLIEKSFGSFEPDLKIFAAKGKVFDYKQIDEIIEKNKNILFFAQELSDNALIDYNNNQTPVVLRGVDKNYKKVFNVDTVMISGSFRLYDFDFDVSAVGLGLASILNLGVDYLNPLQIYVPVRERKINLARPDAAFKKGEVYVSGVFRTNQPEYDDKMLIVPIDFTRKMYDYDSLTVSAINLKLKDIKISAKTKKQLQQDLGNKYLVQNRLEQQKDFFKIVKIERLLVFLILAFILFIAICNIIGSLSMLLIEKKENIQTLRNLGANKKNINRIFIAEGWLLSIIGTIAGIFIGLIVCILQQNFGFIKMGSGSYIENYPVVISLTDILAILVTVLITGFLAAFYTVRAFAKNQDKVEV